MCSIFTYGGYFMKFKLDRQNLKEQLFVIGTLTGAFLSIRMLFFIYVSQEWYYTVGIASAFGFAIFILSKHNKLGLFGRIFIKQLKALTTAPNANIYYAYFAITIIASCVTLYYIDQGNHALFSERQLFLALDMQANPHMRIDLQNANVELPDAYITTKASFMTQSEKENYILSHVKDGNFIMALLLSLENSEWKGWLENFADVTLAGELEGLALFLYYKKVATKLQV